MADKNELIKHAQEETEGEGRKCPICGNDKWDIGEDVYMISASGSGSDVEVACAKCTNCGFVAFFAET